MPSELQPRKLAKRALTVAVLVVVIALLAVVLVGPHKSGLLTAVPACGAAVVVALVVLLPRVGTGALRERSGRIARALSAGRRTLVGGITEALSLVRRADPLLVI